MAHLGETVNARIKQFRLMNGINMQELAERAGISRAVVVNIERNRKTDLTFSELVAIADALGVPLVALVYEVEKPRKAIQVGRHEMDVFNAVRTLVGEGETIWDIHDTPSTDYVAEVLDATAKLDEAQTRLFSLASNLFFSVLRGTGIEEMVSVLLSNSYTHKSPEVQTLLNETLAEHDRASYALFLIEQIGTETQRWKEAASALRALGGEPGTFLDAQHVWQNTEILDDGIDQATP
ncbi:helix-turn-helix domain-containing protein [Microbacterium trichothecenolyticum]|uniref:Transcriptional regulator with XRE-family HTH domain n=1 Tax=Microbacterium trichothecenolyticum TaxID=69370 RepID=A0ABU0TR67_MICTR|nr:helix-turn-helix transcriptional regulator [Microbacterium trichothecenolyticum]MDQ1122172.1 transcriptional regulator with XRE-family HTH domain [Microbacterium trichothecenolyticum]